MPIPQRNDLSIYILNVGQADTAVIRTPAGKAVVIDAVAPNKVRKLLEDLGLAPGEPIEELIITHPHRDHFSAANSLVRTHRPGSVSLAPFWHEQGWGSNQYKALVNTIEELDLPVQFVSGYGRIYPDPFLDANAAGEVTVRGDVPFLELLGPPNSMLRNLAGEEGYGINHLSVMARLTWQDFSMVFAGDAQMENWSHYDSEGMLETGCRVLKAAHHGSKNGTQWERIYRLGPGLVVVSSEFDGAHHIPDVIGCAVLKEYQEYSQDHLVCLTERTGTIEIRVKPGGGYDIFRFGDPKDQEVNLGNETALDRATDRTDWGELLQARLQEA